MACVEDTAIALPTGGDLALRIQRPAVASDVVVVYAHGGGWVIGDLDSHQASAARIAASTPATVVQMDYRLAPEHPFPAGLDDVVAAVRWTADRLGELGCRRLVLAGDSAGGNLALAAAVQCRDAGIALAALLALYPVTDWSRASIDGLPRIYLHGREEAATDPRVSPALADLDGLPPTIVGVGALDFLFEDNLAFVQRLREAEVPVTLRAFPTLDHGFFGYATVSAAADRASERLCRDLSLLLWDSSS